MTDFANVIQVPWSFDSRVDVDRSCLYAQTFACVLGEVKGYQTVPATTKQNIRVTEPLENLRALSQSFGLGFSNDLKNRRRFTLCQTLPSGTISADDEDNSTSSREFLWQWHRFRRGSSRI
jgi:hypothetical protein